MGAPQQQAIQYPVAVEETPAQPFPERTLEDLVKTFGPWTVLGLALVGAVVVFWFRREFLGLVKRKLRKWLADG